ncbi:MAG: HAMP domain-containing histidine kinase [Lachnospiraceae bacterium]|nr:HAMP domain-containing histidine kinase [Lachnospiraceae bacterium]
MKNRNNINPFFRIFGVVIVLVLVSVAAGICLFYYVFAIPEPEGLSLADWPNRFTDNFSIWLECEKGEIKVKDIGLEYLDEYGLWLQIVDEKGKEIYAYHKPDGYPTSYSAAELMAFNASNYDNENTVFAGSYEGSDQTYGYIVGFPYAIGKHMIYYNGENVSRLSPIFRIGIVLVLAAVFAVVLVYGLWLLKHLGKITTGIRDIRLRTYIPMEEKGLFSDVYASLNEMDTEIHHSDKLQEDTERVRKEWITNITHDIKTPLSPIKGYAELLAENPMPEGKTVQEYGGIILKNVNYTEKLINDLKMTYQFETGVVPLSLQKIYLVRYIRELVIDIINDPVFSNRNIEFESTATSCGDTCVPYDKNAVKDIVVCLDAGLFRRAMENLIINALTHNSSETKVTIIVNTDKLNEVSIIVRDDGIGMSDEELSELFERYYRGTNMKEKPEGSGLGLAIAKQIITLHGGNITVKSKPHEGMEFVVSLPIKT